MPKEACKAVARRMINQSGNSGALPSAFATGFDRRLRALSPFSITRPNPGVELSLAIKYLRQFQASQSGRFSCF